MIEVGDLVRVKSKYLSAIFYGHDNAGRKIRGKSVICRVVKVIRDKWKVKRSTIELDKYPIENTPNICITNRFDSRFFVVHKKAKENLKLRRDSKFSKKEAQFKKQMDEQPQFMFHKKFEM